MKVTAIETIRSEEFPNLLWVQVLTDEGVDGLGETFYGPAAAEGHIHGTIAPYLIGKDPRNIEAHQAHLAGYIGFVGASAEMRGRSAVDIALWDILGQSVNLPLCDLLGGRVRDQIKVYNTCAGYSYVQTKPTQGTANFGLDATKGQYEDLDAFLNRADELALSPARAGHHGHEDLAVRLCGRGARRATGSRAADLKQGAASPSRRSARPSATAWRSPPSCTRCGAGRRPIKIARALEPTTRRCGSRTRCSWTTWPRSARWRARRARPSRSARRAAAAPTSASCWSWKRCRW